MDIWIVYEKPDNRSVQNATEIQMLHAFEAEGWPPETRGGWGDNLINNGCGPGARKENFHLRKRSWYLMFDGHILTNVHMLINKHDIVNL